MEYRPQLYAQQVVRIEIRIRFAQNIDAPNQASTRAQFEPAHEPQSGNMLRSKTERRKIEFLFCSSELTRCELQQQSPTQNVGILRFPAPKVDLTVKLYGALSCCCIGTTGKVYPV